MEDISKSYDVGIGQRLSVFRKHLKLKQKEAADKFGVSLNSWGRFETAKRKPSSDLLKELAIARLNINWLMTGEPPMLIDHIKESTAEYKKEGALSREERIVVDNFRALSVDDRAHAKALFSALASKNVKKDKTG